MFGSFLVPLIYCSIFCTMFFDFVIFWTSCLFAQTDANERNKERACDGPRLWGPYALSVPCVLHDILPNRLLDVASW